MKIRPPMKGAYLARLGMPFSCAQNKVKENKNENIKMDGKYRI